MSLTRLLPVCLGLLLCPGLAPAQGKVEISLKNQSKSEEQTRERLQKLLGQYDLSKWLFTRKVMVEDGVIPHSHPILTMNTREDGDVLLATFVHEQIHWFLDDHDAQTEQAKTELRAIYPKVPVGPPNGARNEESSYLHLIVTWLEYEAMRELVGPARARTVFEAKRYYRWIYQTVLSDGPKIKAVIEKHRLMI